jgi:hypothetical protein
LVALGAIAPAGASAGNGFFPAPLVSYHSLGTDLTNVTVADFNNDGFDDIAATNADSDTVSIRLNDGSNGFLSQTTETVGDLPKGLDTGDFNGDGDADIAVANLSTSAVNPSTFSILLGSGNGDFSESGPFATGVRPENVAVGDFNEDGSDDVAIPLQTTGLGVYINNGGGSAFTAAAGSPYNVGNPMDQNPEDAAVGDFDDDGDDDLVTITRSTAGGGGPGSAYVRLGAGNGTFSTSAPGTPDGLLNGPYRVLVADFNEDGEEDVMTTNTDSSDNSLLLGNGTGALAAAVDAPSGVGTNGLVLGDFNSDTHIDYIATGSPFTNVLGAGDGTFPDPSYSNIPAIDDAALGDFNKDGIQDLALVIAANQVQIRRGDGVSEDAGNLLTNGGAEAAGATTQPPLLFPIPPGWTRTGNFSYVRYDSAEDMPRRDFSNLIEGGGGFFAGGPGAADSSAQQTVSVAGSAVSIDAGLATVRLRAYLGGHRDGNDRMAMITTFLDGAGNPLGAPAQLGPVTNVDRRNRTSLLRRETTAGIPAGTRQIRVSLHATRVSGNYVDAYADRVGVFLTAPAPPAAPKPAAKKKCKKKRKLKKGKCVKKKKKRRKKK